MAMQREWLLSFGAVVLAFLSTQHHNLMMLFLALGLGDAGISVMTDVPLVRTAMLVMSLVMVGAIGYEISRPGRPRAMRSRAPRGRYARRQVRVRAGALTPHARCWRALQSGHSRLSESARPKLDCSPRLPALLRRRPSRLPPLSGHARERLKAPCVYLGHRVAKSLSQIACRQVHVLPGRFQILMSRKTGDLVQIPAHARQIGQAQVTQRMGQNAATPARSAIDRTTLDHVHRLMGAA